MTWGWVAKATVASAVVVALPVPALFFVVVWMLLTERNN